MNKIQKVKYAMQMRIAYSKCPLELLLISLDECKKAIEKKTKKGGLRE